MLRDVTHWKFKGHGEMSTLPKEDILSPEGKTYVMKYPRPFDGKRVNWEDVNEVIAAKLASMLGLKSLKAEIAYRDSRRGCLSLHFVEDEEADFGETAASLLTSQFGDKYSNIKESSLNSLDLTNEAFELLKDFMYFDAIRLEFISMNIFDILIGNQDRHAYNWQILFKENKYFFAPLYDNGASLGWQLSDDQLQLMLTDEHRMWQFFKNTKVKSGVLEHKRPPLKAIDVLSYIKNSYNEELNVFLTNMKKFDWNQFTLYINQFPLISDVRKDFLLRFIEYRMTKIMKLSEKEGD